MRRPVKCSEPMPLSTSAVDHHARQAARRQLEARDARPVAIEDLDALLLERRVGDGKRPVGGGRERRRAQHAPASPPMVTSGSHHGARRVDAIDAVPRGDRTRRGAARRRLQRKRLLEAAGDARPAPRRPLAAQPSGCARQQRPRRRRPGRRDQRSAETAAADAAPPPVRGHAGARLTASAQNCFTLRMAASTSADLRQDGLLECRRVGHRACRGRRRG